MVVVIIISVMRCFLIPNDWTEEGSHRSRCRSVPRYPQLSADENSLFANPFSRSYLSDKFLRLKMYENSNTKIFKYKFCIEITRKKVCLYIDITWKSEGPRFEHWKVRAIFFLSFECFWLTEKKNLIPHTCAFYRRNTCRRNSLLLQLFKSTFCYRSNRKICQNYCTMPFTELWNVGKMSSNFVLKEKSTIITHIRKNNTIIQLYFPFCF